MTRGPLTGNLVDFVFDSLNRLIQACSTVYRYDAENQRIGVNQTQYVVNSQPALSQVLVKQDNGQKTFYVYGLGLIGQELNGESLSYHFDFRGSTIALTDESGQVVERFQCSPYGMLLSGNVEKTPFLFNGMYGVMSDSNGLYYMRARYYSPEIRRFINQDILLGNIAEDQSLNRYAYVTGDPISKIDPFGLAEYCGECANVDCLLYGGNLCSEQPEDDHIPRPYVGLSSDKTLVFLVGGFSHQTAVIFDPVKMKSCLTSTNCILISVGIYGGTSIGGPVGIAMGEIEEYLAGWSVGIAGDLGFGESAGFEASCGIDKDKGITALGSSKSPLKYGIGGGFWLGIPICNTTILKCF
jgi:RHS repeat-associated protein